MKNKYLLLLIAYSCLVLSACDSNSSSAPEIVILTESEQTQLRLANEFSFGKFSREGK